MKADTEICLEETHYPTVTTKTASSLPKNMFRGAALVKLWLVLVITFGFCVLMLICAHVTHSLTLRVEAYHTLYNLLALAGCMLSMQVCQKEDNLKNTFGWARMELLSTLCTLLFLGSLCFGVAMDCIQTAAHAGHQDAMHHPTYVIGLGAIGLCLNAFVFCLIGGYTHHQGCFLERRPSGVWIRGRVSKDAVESGMRTLSAAPSEHPSAQVQTRSYQGALGTFRDITGLILVMICAGIVLWDEGGTFALYVDPALAVVSAGILLCLSYPYGKECCQILLQTIPGHIDVHSFSGRLLHTFPEIVNIHHLHIWSLTPGKVIATVHVVFVNPEVYHNSSKALMKFFEEEEITKVTLQPEFINMPVTPANSEYGSCACLLQCGQEHCLNKACCHGDTEVEDASPENASLLSDCSVSLRKRSITEDGLKITVDESGTSAFRIPEFNPKSPVKAKNVTFHNVAQQSNTMYGSLSTLSNCPDKTSFLSLNERTNHSGLPHTSSKVVEFMSTLQDLKNASDQ